METKWALFNPDGLRVEFTDTFGSLQQFAASLQGMQAAGWKVTEPVGNAKEKVARITGFVLASSEDKKLGKYMPSVLLFSDYGQYAQATAYHEHLEQLPVDLAAKGIKTWDGAGITRDDASKKGYMNKCDFEIILTPKLNMDGEPVTNEKGYVQYKFGSVKGAGSPAPLERVADFSMNDVEEMNPDGDLFDVFKWHKDEEWLQIAAGIIQMGELKGDAARLVTYCIKLHSESGSKYLSTVSATGSGSGQYGLLVSRLDGRYGSDSHRMILSALCATPITKENPPGWKVKELLDWLVKPEDNKTKISILDQVVEFIKDVVIEIESP